MARISGVDIPREKRLLISLTYIYGIGRSTAEEICAATDIDPTTRVRDLTDAEVKAVTEGDIPEPERTIYTVAIFTGLRRGELWGLRWEDVRLDGDAPSITVRRSNNGPTKTGKVRRVPLLPQALCALQKIRPAGGNRSAVWLFPTALNGQRSRDDDARWRLRVSVNGDSFLVDRQTPLWLKGFRRGSNAVQLELLDGRGEALNPPFNSLVLEVDRRTGRAYVAEPIPIGTTVHLHVVDPEAARSEIAQASRAAAQSGAQGVLVFYGSPRGPLSGDAQGDVLSVRRELACDGVTAMVTHGSIGPVGQGNRLLGFATTMLIVPNP